MEGGNLDRINRIKRLIDYFKMTVSEFSAKADISQGNMSAMLNGKRAIGDGILNKISISYDINKKWLLTGEGEIIMNEQKSESNKGVGIIGNNVNGGSINDNKVISEMIDLLRKKDEQIDRLIGIIEKK